MSRVTAARIAPDGTISRVRVDSVESVTEHLSPESEDGYVDHDYNRELGIYVYYVLAPHLRRDPNVLPSWLMQGYYEGPVVVVSDRTPNGDRDPDGFRDLDDCWFDPTLQRVATICNCRAEAIAHVARQRKY